MAINGPKTLIMEHANSGSIDERLSNDSVHADALSAAHSVQTNISRNVKRKLGHCMPVIVRNVPLLEICGKNLAFARARSVIHAVGMEFQWRPTSPQSLPMTHGYFALGLAV